MPRFQTLNIVRCNLQEMAKGKPRIMIVDDNSDDIVCFRTALEHYGYHVDIFTDAEQALAHFSPGLYNVVISDIRMPKISGFEFARKIDGIDKDTKIVLMTAFHMTKEEFDKVMPSTRVDVFIKKPIGMTKLLDHLSVLLGNYKEGRWSRGASISSFIANAPLTLLTLLSVDGNIPIIV